MIAAFQVITLMLLAVAMTLALAHALEYPGKLRLAKEQYLAVQTIYYPGFTFGGLAEVLGMIALAVLAWLLRNSGPVFWLTLAALIAMVVMHAVYWLMTHPVNNFWVRDINLSGAGRRFFGVHAGRQEAEPDWTTLRDRWEMSHIIRAALSVAALLLLTVSLVI